MRKIPCQSCRGRPKMTRESANWIVFDRVLICDTCRLAVIQYWTDVLGFSLAAHPFLDEFIDMNPEPRERILLTFTPDHVVMDRN